MENYDKAGLFRHSADSPPALVCGIPTASLQQTFNERTGIPVILVMALFSSVYQRWSLDFPAVFGSRALQPPSDSNLIPSFRKLLFINLAQSYLCICLLSTDLLHSDVDIISHWLYPMAAKFSLPRDRRPPTSAMQTDACHLFRVHAQPRQGHPLPLQVRNRQRPCNFECTHP